MRQLKNKIKKTILAEFTSLAMFFPYSNNNNNNNDNGNDDNKNNNNNIIGLCKLAVGDRGPFSTVPI